MTKFIQSALFICTLILIFSGTGKAKERPFIWATSGEKAAILQKIEVQPWAKTSFDNLLSRLEKEVAGHQADPDRYLRGMPFDWNSAKPGETPPFTYTTHIVNGTRFNLDNATAEEMANFKKLTACLQTAVDCGVAYYLTNDTKYAQCAADILNASIKGIIQLKPSDFVGRGGWLCPDDILKESRETGDKFPVIYDFIVPFILKGGKPYDIGKQAKIDFPDNQAQQVFRTYADLVVNHGMINSNHPVLEASCLVYNALALEDDAERNKYLNYYLTESTSNQDALNKVAKMYKNEGDIWPETSQYLNAVASLSTRLMFVLTKYDPSLHLGQAYPNIPMALTRLDYLVYPNGEIIRWGDGRRHGETSYGSLEEAFQLGKIDGVKKLTDLFGPLLGGAITRVDYKRGGVFALLWYNEDLQGVTNNIVLPRTDNQAHAGIFLQRNLSATSRPVDGLMCFVGGAHMVHGHAEGMNIELYGKGQVLGVDNGRGNYAVDLHENYSRLFAAHNTVIVNGSSQGDSGWVNQGINTVKLLTMEPLPTTEAVSPGYSFSQTSFEDDKGNKAEAKQERTLALIRTSDSTGYYVDVFRSKSRLPNEYHDFLYHNIGDELDFLNQDMKYSPTPERFMANAKIPWIQNKQYRHPGWHFFEKVETSATYSGDVQVKFKTGKLKDGPVFMQLFIPGSEQREYTRVMAPRTFEAPAPYDKLQTPTLVIRKTGEAWNAPFAVVYEPFDKNIANNTVKSVEKIVQNGFFKGLKITSKIGPKILVHYLIDQVESQDYNDSKLGIQFKGKFALITTDNKNKLLNLYLGDGEKLQFGNITLTAEKSVAGAFLDFSGKIPTLKSNQPVAVTQTNGKNIPIINLNDEKSF